MVKSISEDLRSRVIAAGEAGLSRRDPDGDRDPGRHHPGRAGRDAEGGTWSAVRTKHDLAFSRPSLDDLKKNSARQRAGSARRTRAAAGLVQGPA